MGEPEPMTLSERRKYLRLLQPSYLSAGRQERSQLLDEAGRVTGHHRKTLIHLLRSKLERKRRSCQRGRSYGPQVEYAVRLVARTLDFPCAERLQPALISNASSLAQHGELQVSRELLESLERISVSTVGRMVQRMRRDRVDAASGLCYAGRPFDGSGCGTPVEEPAPRACERGWALFRSGRRPRTARTRRRRSWMRIEKPDP